MHLLNDGKRIFSNYQRLQPAVQKKKKNNNVYSLHLTWIPN